VRNLKIFLFTKSFVAFDRFCCGNVSAMLSWTVLAPWLYQSSFLGKGLAKKEHKFRKLGGEGNEPAASLTAKKEGSNDSSILNTAMSDTGR